MSEYLSKDEIRKWRSSLERITLEEYAKRLGKVIQEQKDEDSLVDSVIVRSLNSMSTEQYSVKTEKIQSFAVKSFNKEKELNKEKETKTAEKIKDISPETVNTEETAQEAKSRSEKEDVPITFNKALTPREQVVFEHFLANRNVIVYAKDLAAVLDLPRDYVYKYIKGLRSKLNENVLQNADNGGYMFKV